VARGRHRLEHARPWVFDDPFALVLVGPAWREVARRSAERYREPVGREVVGGMVARARYAEDRLAASGCGQYVLLGAGLDSFAWRRPDLLRELRVFEVDHPASQAYKRERIAALGLPESPSLAWAQVDFERETLHDGLERAGFDFSRPAFFSWLGVTMYLTLEAVEATLRAIAGGAPGSEVVFSYGRTDEHLDAIGREFRDRAAAFFQASGEPIHTRLSRAGAEALVARCGLTVADHPDRGDLVARYFAGRQDGLKPYTSEGVLAARC
jgi:methyltransferase (TIGR00027 family)